MKRLKQDPSFRLSLSLPIPNQSVPAGFAAGILSLSFVSTH